jgi:YVTN family beta-propeller protein
MTGVMRTSDTGVLGLGMLGPLQVVRSGVAVPLGGRQQKAILAMLLVEANTVVSIGRLADAVWGERVPNGSVTTIQTYISHLREVLEPDRPRGGTGQFLLTERGGYRLRTEDVAVDSVVFEQRVRTGRALLEEGRFAEASSELVGAFGMWRGPVLADLADYEFARLAAVRLDESRLVAIEDRIEADLALGRHKEVAGELDELITAQPLRERLHGQRMLARYRSGRQAEALAGYQELRAMLADDMGIDPSPPLQQLYRAVLSQDSDLDWHPTVQAAPGQATNPGAATVSTRRRPRRKRLVLAAALAVFAIAAGITGVVVARSTTATLSAFPANSVGRIDARGGMRASLPVGQSPSGVAYGARSVWVANTGDGTVSRIDPRHDRVIQTIKVGASPNAITVTGDDVWVTNAGAGTVSRVNALTNTEADVIHVGNLPTAIASGPAGVWVANGGDDTIQRIDPVTGETGVPIPVGGNPDGIAVGDATVWVANSQDGTVSPVDVATRSPGSPISVGAGPKGMALTPDALWVANALDLTVSRIDLASGHVVQTVPVGDGPNSVVAEPGAVWVSNEFDGTVTRIDPDTGKATRRSATGSSPRGMAMIGSSPWVASGGFASVAHRGGTLTVAAGWVPGGPNIDFQYYYDEPTLAMLYDGLVAQRRTGGADPGAGSRDHPAAAYRRWPCLHLHTSQGDPLLERSGS